MDETSNAFNDINSYNEVLQGSHSVFTKKERIGETILAVGAPITLKITEKALSNVAKKYSKPSVAADEPEEAEAEGGWEFQNPAFEGHLRQWNQDDGMQMDELYPVRGEAIDGIPSQAQGFQEARAMRGAQEGTEAAGEEAAGEEAAEVGGELAEAAVDTSLVAPEVSAIIGVAALGVTLYEGIKDIFDEPKVKKPRAIVSMAQQGV